MQLLGIGRLIILSEDESAWYERRKREIERFEMLEELIKSQSWKCHVTASDTLFKSNHAKGKYTYDKWL